MTTKVDIDKPRLPRMAGYRTEAVLGEGGMATVYLAVQESLSRHVALKVMNQLLTIDADFCRRFLNEGRLVAKLSHPNIVTVYDIGAAANLHYLSMTYLPGGTLRDRLAIGLSPDQALYILKCLADALGYAHRHGIVHRDIKPGNVLFTDSGTPVLTDFGIAKTVGNETRLTSTGMMLGSVGYMSPEQAAGHEVDNRSDLYSLGVLFWQMLTGSLPYSAQDPFALALKHANDPIPRLPGHLRGFQPVIEGLLAKRPDERLGSTEDLLRVLEEIPREPAHIDAASPADETVVVRRGAEPASARPLRSATPDTRPTPAPKRRLQRASALIAVAGAVGIAAFLGYQDWYSPTPEVSPAASSAALAPAAPDAKVELQRAETSDRDRSQPRGNDVTAVALAAPDAASVATPASNRAKPFPNGPPPTAGGDQQRLIETLLRQAEAQWKAGRLTTPPGNNAFETYSRVLDLAPEQVQAKEGLVKIGRINAANKVFESAENLLRQGNIDDARRMIETGLKMNPENERLLGLKRALDF